MAQIDIPAWITVFLGSGGLVGLLTFLVKQVIDAKDESIKTLKREKDRLKEELEKTQKFKSEIQKGLDDLAEKGITSQTYSELRKIEILLSDMQITDAHLKGTKSASEWVKHKEKEWLRQATKAAFRKHADLIPRSQSNAFKKDIANYLRWLHESLDLGFFCQMEEYVQARAVKSPLPYRAAFSKLREIDDFESLLPNEIKYLQDYIDELINAYFD